MSTDPPNILVVMTDQQRFDTISSLGNEHIHTPNLDRLVERGVSFTNAYSQCPVCVPARYTIRTGREPPTTGYYGNKGPFLRDGQPEAMEDRCGPYLPRVMSNAGYRTFGIGKFHTDPRHEDLGYDTQLYAEEGWGDPETRAQEAYPAYIAEEYPEYDFIEQLHGERTEMYYMPQMSPLPAEVTVESWTADRAVEQIREDGDRPFFGLVSFIGPHPPLAPPIPFNRMYDPDRMPAPVQGDKEVDHMDEHIPWMNYKVWADEMDEIRAKACKARYYGEISYIDFCLGKILNAVEALPDADNTLICFCSDHGEMLGDHRGWQKYSFFESSTRIPFLLSWPSELPADERREELVCLTDLFGIATRAAGVPDTRDGIDLLGVLNGDTEPRDRLVGYHGRGEQAVPGGRHFKLMIREGDWKYVFMANGGREQLFNIAEDPNELDQRLFDCPEVADRLRDRAVEELQDRGCNAALKGESLRRFAYQERARQRFYQFDRSRGVEGFPDDPADVYPDGPEDLPSF